MQALIAKYKPINAGKRGYAVILPKIWIDDVKLKKGDILYCYRDTSPQLYITKNPNMPKSKFIKLKKFKLNQLHRFYLPMVWVREVSNPNQIRIYRNEKDMLILEPVSNLSH